MNRLLDVATPLLGTLCEVDLRFRDNGWRQKDLLAPQIQQPVPGSVIETSASPDSSC